MKLLSPSLPSALSPISDLSTLAAKCVENQEPLSGALVEHVQLTGADLSGLMLEGVRFLGCRLLECDCSRWETTDVVFQDCDLSGSTFADGIWSRTALEDCRALGSDFSQCGLHHTAFRGCRLSYANFTAQRVKGGLWSGCDLSQAVLSSCVWSAVAFRDCDLTGTRLFHTPPAGLDLTTCHLEGLVLSDGGEELRGVIVDRWQAGELARRLGIVIRD